MPSERAFLPAARRHRRGQPHRRRAALAARTHAPRAFIPPFADAVNTADTRVFSGQNRGQPVDAHARAS